MIPFKDLVEDSILSEEGAELRELILDYYDAEYDEDLVYEDEEGNEVVAFELGLEIISGLAHTFTPDQIDLIKETMQEMIGLTDEDLDEMSMYEDEDLDEEDLDEIRKKFRIIKKRDKIRLAKKARAVKKLGKNKAGQNKAASAEFRAKKKFDPKKKRFVFRKKKRSISQQKRIDKKFTRRLKRRRRN